MKKEIKSIKDFFENESVILNKPLNYFQQHVDKLESECFFELDQLKNVSDEEFREIELISKDVNSETLLLFWQFTIKTLGELDIVSNQNLSMDMFLIRLLYLKGDRTLNDQEEVELTNEKYSNNNTNKPEHLSLSKNEDNLEMKNKTISQIKNFSQEESSKPEKKN